MEGNRNLRREENFSQQVGVPQLIPQVPTCSSNTSPHQPPHLSLNDVEISMVLNATTEHRV